VAGPGKSGGRTASPRDRGNLLHGEAHLVEDPKRVRPEGRGGRVRAAQPRQPEERRGVGRTPPPGRDVRSIREASSSRAAGTSFTG
jgi:hypothetical protein